MCNKKSFITFALTAVLLLTAGMGCCAANVEETLDVEISAPEIFYNGDVIFAKYDEWPQTTLRMDICGPDDGEKHPAVVLIPGGAWLASPKDAWSHVAFKLAENGFVAASIEYRLIGAASYAEIIGDAKAAVRFLRAHADKFHIDKDKIAVMGSSAGAYLAVMLGVTGDGGKFNFGDNPDQSSAVQAVVDFFGPTDLTKLADDLPEEKKELYYSPSSFASLFVNGVAGYKDRKGGGVLSNPETAQDANPLNYIGEKTPPFLIFHGDADKTVSVSQSKILHEALTEKKIDSTFYIINDGEHLTIYFHQPKILKIIVEFLNRVLR